MIQHTPGPWIYHGGFGQCVKAGLNVVAECRKPPLNHAECEGNARLISAAPEMLAALKMVLQHGRIDDSESRMAQVASAITKAEGK